LGEAVAPEPSIEQNQEKAKSRRWFAKALTPLRIFYQGISWENIKAAVTGSVNNAAKLLWIAACILIIGFVVKDLSTDLVAIEPISVPKAFSENGYTPEVASRRLRDALSDYASKANTSMKGPSIAPRDELPNFVVPKIDLSLDTIVSSIRGVLHYGSRRSISGELIVRGKLAWLRLRVDGQEVHSSPSGFDLENPDELFAAAVPSIIEKIRPYLVASTLYENDPAKGAAKADEIIARLPESDVNVEWSYVLKGLFLVDQTKDYVQAEKVLRKAIRLNDLNRAAHINLGDALYGQGKFEEAIVECRRAIELDPKDAFPHNNLGIALGMQGNIDDAITEFRRAIELDPKYANAHYNLGLALSKQGKVDEAAAEYRRAIEFNPKDADPHFNLGFILDDQDKFDEAAVEYGHAIRLDPKHSNAHNHYSEPPGKA
jgi:Flp pilus assembly protein TadD